MVYVRDNNSDWVLYDIVRDWQGSITHLVDDSDGTIVAEYSYDPWGRLRDPETLEIYTPGSSTMPDLMLGRGYTAHEHLDWFGLINMNARLYDPALGRFLSPDPCVQAPDFSQNFNRYSYCLNNPLKYTDEDGKVFTIFKTFLIDFLVKGFFEGGFDPTSKEARQKAWKAFDPTAPWSKTYKAAQIELGKIAWNSDQTVVGNIISIFSRNTWEIAQTAAGGSLSHFRNMFWDVSVERFHGATVVDRKDKTDDWWGVTLGPYINTFNKDKEMNLVPHEYGHTIQSKYLGPLYIPIIGVPSLKGSIMQDISSHKHDDEWYEIWANDLSNLYLDKHDPDFQWNYRKNPTEYDPIPKAPYFWMTLRYYLSLTISLFIIL